MNEELFCNQCNKFIEDDEREKMEEDELSHEDRHYNVNERTCLECRTEIREEIKELEGDYSPLHPEETAEEFEEHEDHVV